MRIAYLHSRLPLPPQTFRETEMQEMGRRGNDLLVLSIHPPLTSLGCEHGPRLSSSVQYPPPAPVLQLWEAKNRDSGHWPEALIKRQESRYKRNGAAELHAAHACYFAELCARHGIEHFHVHFANDAAHTALFLTGISGIPFSVAVRGQDFISGPAEDDLLQEICAAAQFVVTDNNYSRDLLRTRCPDAAPKIHRVYQGVDLATLSGPPTAERAPGPIKILSVGRLIPATGFETLIEACAELDRRNLDFRCEIIGEGPERGNLQALLAELNLRNRVTLCGGLSDAEVSGKLETCDIFALASAADEQAASDAFPNIIMEAMACARPVIATNVAGIPEMVQDSRTGLLVPPGDWEEFARALEKLVRDPELRTRLGRAGRARMEKEFDISKTIESLHELLTASIAATSAKRPAPAPQPGPKKTAYLIERWPDPELPFLEMELRALRRDNVPHVAFILRPPSDELPPKTHDLAREFQYLPDAMVIEAEWHANQKIVREWELWRAEHQSRPPSALFLEQARAALMLRRLFDRQGIGHVHATSSRTLLCAFFLKKMLGLSISYAVEEKPLLEERFIAAALDQCVGGRSKNRELLARRGSGFMFDEAIDRPSVNDIGPWLTRKTKIEWTGGHSFWEEWSKRLTDWTQRA